MGSTVRNLGKSKPPLTKTLPPMIPTMTYIYITVRSGISGISSGGWGPAAKRKGKTGWSYPMTASVGDRNSNLDHLLGISRAFQFYMYIHWRKWLQLPKIHLRLNICWVSRFGDNKSKYIQILVPFKNSDINLSTARLATDNFLTHYLKNLSQVRPYLLQALSINAMTLKSSAVTKHSLKLLKTSLNSL